MIVSTHPHPRGPEPRAASPNRGVPLLFRGLADDAAVFPPGNAPLAEALAAHRAHRAAWYGELVGPLLVPVTELARAGGLLDPGERIEIGLVGERAALGGVLTALPHGFVLRRIESAVAKRGEDPLPGLGEFLTLLEAGTVPGATGYAEIPLTAGLLAALDGIAEARGRGIAVAPKFRTGGLAAELFPTPAELAGVICACRDRGLAFQLTAGLHHAVRHGDPETGLTHHGFLNVLVATAIAADGARPRAVAEVLSGTDPLPLVEAARARRDSERPLWTGFGTCSIQEPLLDLQKFGLLPAGGGDR